MLIDAKISDEYIKLLKDLLACYRLERRVSEKLLNGLEKAERKYEEERANEL